MQVKAQAKNIRISAKKARLVIDLVRGKKVDDAITQLMFMNKRASTPVKKVIESAIANAEHNNKLNRKDLYIKSITIDEGLTYKRWMPRAYGRATPIRKRGSHINVILALLEGVLPSASDSKTSKSKSTKEADKKATKDDKKIIDAKSKGAVKEKKAGPVDERRMGKHRHNQAQDKSSMKEKGGAVKKTFNKRKAS